MGDEESRAGLLSAICDFLNFPDTEIPLIAFCSPYLKAPKAVRQKEFEDVIRRLVGTDEWQPDDEMAYVFSGWQKLQLELWWWITPHRSTKTEKTEEGAMITPGFGYMYSKDATPICAEVFPYLGIEDEGELRSVVRISHFSSFYPGIELSDAGRKKGYTCFVEPDENSLSPLTVRTMKKPGEGFSVEVSPHQIGTLIIWNFFQALLGKDPEKLLVKCPALVAQPRGKGMKRVNKNCGRWFFAGEGRGRKWEYCSKRCGNRMRQQSYNPLKKSNVR
ncbi:MAG TPA: hypothetical protein VI895_01015 [Bdellovibrionota bacterium]|nr:hypothetical protein [Bdellovibrionota bacterium]